jgi:hypothetical protein
MIKSDSKLHLSLTRNSDSERVCEDYNYVEFPVMIIEPENAEQEIYGSINNSKINGKKLEMVMEICFNYSTNLGRDIWCHRREMFINDVISTYLLFTEIEERLKKKIL